MIFAAAALLTPPDPITQIGLAIPLLILYELSIFSVNIIEKKIKKMHNIKEIRNDIEAFKKALNKRFLDIDVDKILSLDENNRKYIQQKELLEKEKKDISKSKDQSLFEKSKKISLKLKKLVNYKLMLKMN